MAPNQEELRTSSNVGNEPAWRPPVQQDSEHALRIELFKVALPALLTRPEATPLDPQDIVDTALLIAEQGVRALAGGGAA